MQFYRRQQLLNHNKKEKFSKIKIVGDYGKSINKEFIPIFFILIVPVFSYLEGYGIKTIKFCCKDLFYLLPVIFGFFMNIYERNKILNIQFFLILLIAWFLKNLPVLTIDRYFNGNYTMLIISDLIILCFYLLISISFWVNNPYFISYYKSNLKSYIIIYKIFAVYFFGIFITLIIYFIKIFYILKTVYD